MDPTYHQSNRIEVRGGTIEVMSGRSRGASLVVGSEPQIVGRHAECALALPDKSVSGMHVEVLATEKGLRVRDLGSSNGTFLDDHRIEAAVFTTTASIRCGDTVLEVRPGEIERVPLSRSHHFGKLVGGSPSMRALFEQLRRLAPTTVSVLIGGETGTGKELVAQALHDASDRAKKPFNILDCTSIPAQLAESALFGHEKGAFTGADSKRISPFVAAHGGTIFLDEIGELPLELQPKLLRALEQGRIQAVGANRFEEFDVRVIAATHRDLAPASSAGRFREDLYFRIARAHVRVPPLRERTEDIQGLVKTMMDVKKPDAFRRVPEKAFKRLVRHSWPGNVRELRNLVEVAIAYDKGGRIDLAEYLDEMLSSRSSAPTKDAPPEAPPTENGASKWPFPHQPYPSWLDEAHRAYFGALYERAGGNLSEMARESEVHRDTIRTHLRTLRIGKYARR